MKLKDFFKYYFENILVLLFVIIIVFILVYTLMSDSKTSFYDQHTLKDNLALVTGDLNIEIYYTTKCLDNDKTCTLFEVTNYRILDEESNLLLNEYNLNDIKNVDDFMDVLLSNDDFILKIYSDSNLIESASVLNKEEIQIKVNEILQTNNLFNVIFNSNGGSLVPSQTVEEGETVVIPDNPIRTGYIFVGWNFNNVAYNFDSVVSSNLELIANWEKVSNSNSSNNTENDNANDNVENENNDNNVPNDDVPLNNDNAVEISKLELEIQKLNNQIISLNNDILSTENNIKQLEITLESHKKDLVDAEKSLENAKNNKVIKVWNGSSWTWIADQDAINDAQYSVDFYKNLVLSYENLIIDEKNDIVNYQNKISEVQSEIAILNSEITKLK